MLNVDGALNLILSDLAPLPAVRVPLPASLGLALATDIYAAGDVPSFANSSMDGYAVRAADTAGAGSQPVSLRVVGSVAAGYLSDRTLQPGEAIRIMTGAPLPTGADAVVRFEDTSDADTQAARHRSGLSAIASQPDAAAAQAPSDVVEIRATVAPGTATRAAGEDIHSGELVLTAGTRLRPAEIGVLASLGYAEIPVIRRPKVAILATGDELVEPSGSLLSGTYSMRATRVGDHTMIASVLSKPGQIFDSNSYTLAAAVQRLGADPIPLGIARDDPADLTARLQAGVEAGADLFLTAGGVSMGDYDVVKNVLIEAGQVNFWQVKLRPGKPLVYGRWAGVPFMGLPGNPVSALVSFDVFARPAIQKLGGGPQRELTSVQATLTEPIRNEGDRRFYCRMIVTQDPATARYYARSSGAQGSGILTSITRANAYLVVPEEVDTIPAGSTVRVLLFEA